MAGFLVTGANRGIGLELTRQAARRGDKIIATCRNPAAASALAKLAGEAGGRIEIVALDIAEPASIAAATARLGRRPIDVLINNAGILGPARQSGLDMDFDGLAHTLAVNAIGPLRVTQALLPNLRAAGHAKVVAISSRMASLADPASSSLAYRASKAALNKLFQGLATDLAPQGIAVLILTPGWVRTDMGGAARPALRRRERRRDIPRDRRADPRPQRPFPRLRRSRGSVVKPALPNRRSFSRRQILLWVGAVGVSSSSMAQETDQLYPLTDDGGHPVSNTPIPSNWTRWGCRGSSGPAPPRRR